ncbi:excinuclease ABC subunit A [Lactobacillus sp. CBA3605]|uniref:Y-family DNA polymerase n=1 Tax=Lactobacillus sp. CBA3605 TaxID=2099788 RepID=UPI000CFC132B|nr:Y-family DNA polymerase [Lactobacillus sp. CBA3605]AVK60348.1 excinuclease ABC subunit A [Lactobacillus sp. CBA3605]
MFIDKEPRGVYFLIDNKSFYASIEAIQRGLNPLKVPLVVMSEQANTNGGLILATSPTAKQLFHLKANVSRQRDLPRDPRLMVVPPRMNLYIQRNLQINQIFSRFVAEEDLLPYSIDESLLNCTHSLRLYGKNPKELAQLIQKTIRQELGLYTTVGIGDNPVQAKIALDIYAKHNPDLIGEIHYETVPQKIWEIPEMTDVWSIGSRTAKRLAALGIQNMYDLAHYNPYLLKQQLGVIGAQLFAIAWGVDRSDMRYRPQTRAASLGNSQVLPRDYRSPVEINTVIKEIGEQVAARLRSHNKLASQLSLSLGFSFATTQDDGRSGLTKTMAIDPTNDNFEITRALHYLFKTNWAGQSIRNISVYAAKLSPNTGQQLNLFQDTQQQQKKAQINQVVDDIRNRFGFTKLVYGNSLLTGSTAIQRASLVGGHNGGNAYD